MAADLLAAGGPAFPLANAEASMLAEAAEDLANPALDGAERTYYQVKADALSGMSLRDHFAGLALQAAISGHISHYGHESNHWSVEDIASHAYEQADAMLKARAR